MTEVLDEVYQKWETFNDEQKAGLSEAIAGKQQASVFQALMQNFETYKKVRNDFANNSHFNSMTKENEQYVDSISGKLNKLKETWISIGTTIVSSDFTKGLLDGAIAVSEAIEKIVQALDKVNMLTPVMSGLGLTFGKMIKNSLSGGSMFTTITRDLDTTTQKMTLFQRATSGIGNTVKGVGSSLKSAGSMLLGFGKSLLTNAGIMLAVSVGIKAVSWGYNELTNKVKSTGEALKEIEESQLNEIGNNKNKLNSLQTIGKQYEELSQKANKSAEDQAKLIELGNELAEVMPELKIGTDSDGNAIISMTNNMDGYINKTKEAIAQQERLLLGTRLDESDNALKMMTKGEIIGKGLNEQKIDIQEDYNKRMVDLEKHYSQAMLNVQNSHGEKQKEHMQEARKIKDDMIKAESEYGNKYAEVQAQIMEQSGKHRNTMESLWKTSADMLVNDLMPEVENGIQAFTNSMDFSQIDSTSELDSVKRIFREIPKMAQEGKINIEQLNTQLSDINSEFAKTGNIKDYNMNMEKLAESVSAQTGWDVSVLTEMFTTITDGTLKGSHSLDNFLSKFNKTTQDIQNGDGLAKALQGQYQAIEDYINQINNADLSDTEMNAQIRVNLQTDKNLPKQVRDMVTNMSNLGVDDSVIIPITAEVLMALKDGGISKDEMVILKQRIDQQMNDSLGKDYTTEMKMQIHGYLDKLNTKDIQKDIEGELKNTPTEKEIEVKYNTTGEEDLKSADEYLKTLEGRPDVYKEVKTVVQGKEELALYGEIIEKLPVNQEFTNKFIVDNKQAISEMKTYQEVVDFINKQPKEFKSKYGFVIENADGVEQAIDNIDAKTKDEKQLSIKTNEGEILDSIKDVETLIDLSAKVEDGKYKLDIEANTQGAVENIDTLKNSVNELSNQFRNSPITTVRFNVETAQSAQNITGLKTRIEEFKTLAGSVTTVKFNTDTATASQNVTGLKNNVSSYVKSYCGKSFSTKFNCQTALASQNVSGLRRNVSSYVASYGGKTFTTTFKVVTNKVTNVSTVSSGGGKEPKGTTKSLVKSASVMTSQVHPMALNKVESSPGNITSLAQKSPIMSRSVSTAPKASSAVTSLSSSVSPMSSRAISEKKSPLAGEALNYFRFDVSAFKNLETALDKISKQLDFIDKKTKVVFGKEKELLLKQKLELLNKQQSIQSQMAGDMRVYQNELKYYLSQKGVAFDKDGNVVKEQEKLLSIQKQLKDLEDKSSNSKDDKAKKGYDAQKTALEETKKALEEYISISNGKIPGCSAEWWELEQQINETRIEILKAKDELANFKIEINIQKFELAIKKVRNELKKLDRDIEKAFGSKKESLINKKIDLIKKEQQELHKLANQYREQAKLIGEFLNSKGFNIDPDGMIDVGYLENLKDSGIYDYIKEQLEKYIELTQDKIPGLSDDWWELQESIEDVKEEIEEARKELQEFLEKARIDDLVDKFKDLQHEIEMVDKLLKHSYGTEKIDLLNKKVELLKQQQIELQKQYEYFNNKKNNLQDDLGNLGFTFDNDGNITNHISQLEKLANESNNFDDIKKKLEDYFDLQDDRLPGIEEDWLDLDNAIKDALKEQLEVTKDVQDKITQIYKKQAEERKKLIDDELKKRLDALKKEQDAYNDYRDKQKYDNKYNEQSKVVNDLQAQIDLAKKDTSIKGQKKLQELLKQLEEEKKKLQEIVQDKIDKDVNDMFDKENDRLEQEAEDMKDAIDDKYSDEKLQEIVDKTLSTGVFETIDGELLNLQDVMMEFINKYDDGMTAIGGIIKDEWVTNLEIAKDTMKDIVDIYDKLNVGKFDSSMASRTFNPSSINKTSEINFNQPLVVIEGNADDSTAEKLSGIVDDLKNDIISEIVREYR